MNAATRQGDWMQTYTGGTYWPLDPRADEVRIEDIAHHLSMLCRYTGACRRFYSVAEHSVHVSRLVAPEFALQGLMHDAPEAYVNDIARPLKPFLANYDQIEDRNWLAICERFDLAPELDPSVKVMDNRICRTEKEQIMRSTPRDGLWSHLGEPADVRIIGWSPDVAERFFLARFRELTQ